MTVHPPGLPPPSPRASRPGLTYVCRAGGGTFPARILGRSGCSEGPSRLLDTDTGPTSGCTSGPLLPADDTGTLGGGGHKTHSDESAHRTISPSDARLDAAWMEQAPCFGFLRLLREITGSLAAKCFHVFHR